MVKEELNENKKNTDIDEYIKIRREWLKNLRYAQCARLYDAKTERINNWFRYHK